MTERHAEGRLASGQYWQSWSGPAPGGLVVVVHGVHEHSGRYHWVAERLVAAGYDVYAVDHPGHGRSPGRRGNITSMATAVDGVDAVTRLAAERVPGVPVFVYGHSLGGLIALQYLTGQPDDRISGGIISAPALDTSAATPAQRRLAPLVSALAPNLGMLTLDLEAVSRDPEVVGAYRADPLNYLGKMTARTGTELMVTATAMPARLAGLTMPLFVLHGGADRLVPPAAGALVREHAGSPDLTLKIYEGLYHEPHNEPEREQVLADIVSWLDAHR
ncbi:alpha/beta hydrolase [Actinoplanes sp. CA-030573]|uniref:alpha/beta hydrolase n=1 Tax=Actinoplanes sp. CA-030573 TaxID=3239898 RepID=UPI003D92F1B7